MELLKRAIPAVLAAAILPASAHVVLDQKQAEGGKGYKAAFVVGHGCAGGHATTGLTVRFPEGVTAVKPVPKPGWTIEVKRVPIDKPYEYYGRTISDRVAEITWKGGALPFDWYDEFVAVMRLPEKGGKLYFKATQSCGDVAMEWVDAARDSKTPAAELEVLEKKGVEEVHKH